MNERLKRALRQVDKKIAEAPWWSKGDPYFICIRGWAEAAKALYEASISLKSGHPKIEVEEAIAQFCNNILGEEVKSCSKCFHDEHGSVRCMPLSSMTDKPVPGDPVCACIGGYMDKPTTRKERDEQARALSRHLPAHVFALRLIEQVNQFEDSREFMLDKYSEVGARPCWICHYEEGKFKKLCRLHDIIREMGTCFE